MAKLHVTKTPGKSWTIGPDGKCHTFLANDKSHPMTKVIYLKWQELAALMNYEPDTRWALQNESEKAKQLRLCKHSEKLALCYALLTLPEGVLPVFTCYILHD